MQNNNLVSQSWRQVVTALTLAWLSTLVLLMIPAETTQAQEESPWPDTCLEQTLTTTSGLTQTILSCFPEDAASWNGILLLYVRGTVLSGSVGLPDNELVFGDFSLPKFLLELNYAFATSSLEKTGLVVEAGADNINQLLSTIEGELAPRQPEHILLIGLSQGALIATLLTEQYSERYDGTLALCGPIAGMPYQTRSLGDFSYTFDALFPGVLPFEAGQIVPVTSSVWSEVYEPVVTQQILANPTQTQRLLQLTGAAYDAAEPTTAITTTRSNLAYSFSSQADFLEVVGGQGFDNRWQHYAEDINAHIKRAQADRVARSYLTRYYEPTGVLSIPLVTLHTLGDNLVPYEHELIYQRRVVEQGREDLLTTFAYDRYGHCTFTLAEMAQGLDALLTAVGVPEGRSVLAAEPMLLSGEQIWHLQPEISRGRPIEPAMLPPLPTLQAPTAPVDESLQRRDVSQAASVRYVAADGLDTANTCIDPANPCASLGYALGQAAADDEIRLAGGTYQTQALITQSLTVRGGYTRSNWLTPTLAVSHTILDAGGQGTSIWVRGPVTVTLEHLSITGGQVLTGGTGTLDGFQVGGAIFGTDADLTLRNTRLFSNVAQHGGGVYWVDGELKLVSTTLQSNHAAIRGGGLYLDHSRAAVVDSLLASNESGQDGGGVYGIGSRLTLTRSLVLSNQAGRSGGGLAIEDTTFEAYFSRIEANQAAGFGGGASALDGYSTAAQVFVLDNVAGQSGAAFDWLLGEATGVNWVLVNNEAGQGAAMAAIDTDLQLGHLSLVQQLHGVALGEHSRLQLQNSLVVSHSQAITVAASAQAALTRTLFFANQVNLTGTGIVAPNDGFTANPGFIPGQAFPYQLALGSAAVDRAVPGLTDIDVDGQLRDARPDIGAFEQQGLSWPVYLPLIVRLN